MLIDRTPSLFEYFLPFLLIIFILYGIILFYKANKECPKWFKFTSFVSFFTAFSGLVFIIGDKLGVLDFGTYFFISMLVFPIISILLVISSILLFRTKEKFISFFGFLYGIFYFLIWLYFESNFHGM
jgi:hypothetical protein